MTVRREGLWALAVMAAAYALPSSAHHSFAAEFDRAKPVTLEGVVTQVQWQNPHTRIFLDVMDTSGTSVNWELELSSPNSLLRAGWTRNSLRGGETITVKGFLAKDGTRLANANTITADGKLILSETATANGATAP